MMVPALSRMVLVWPARYASSGIGPGEMGVLHGVVFADPHRRKPPAPVNNVSLVRFQCSRWLTDRPNAPCVSNSENLMTAPSISFRRWSDRLWLQWVLGTSRTMTRMPAVHGAQHRLRAPRIGGADLRLTGFGDGDLDEWACQLRITNKRAPGPVGAGIHTL